jgi:hypothetical protein
MMKSWAPEGQMVQVEMKCRVDQDYSDERCGPWASCCNCLPFEEDLALLLNNLESPLPNDYFDNFD